MWGELTNIRKQVIFTKMISLNRLNYDMIEGEAMVKLRDYLQYPYSCQNELFELKYYFTLKAFFGEEDEEMMSFQEMVVE